MAKNAFYIQQQKRLREEYRKGASDGMKMAFDLVAVALNHEFGFGDERITRLEAKLAELVKEINVTNDPDVTNAHLDKALKQIRGEDFVRWS